MIISFQVISPLHNLVTYDPMFPIDPQLVTILPHQPNLQLCDAYQSMTYTTICLVSFISLRAYNLPPL